MDGVEGVEVARRRKARLRAGDIEADDAGVAPADRAARRSRPSARTGASPVHEDLMAIGCRLPRLARCRCGSPPGRLDDLVERQAALGRQLGRVADLGIDDAIGGQVLGALGGHAHDRVAASASRRRCGRSSRGRARATCGRRPADNGRQLVGVGGRQAVVAVLGGELDDRRRAAVRRRDGRAAAPWGPSDRLEREHASGPGERQPREDLSGHERPRIPQ